MHSRIRWGQAPTGWEVPGWAPLVDPGPRPLQTARSMSRWWWPTVTISGFLAVAVHVLGHDDRTPNLAGMLTVALAALVVVLLTIHRRNGPRPLTRAVTEYTVVALLAALLAAPGGTVDQPPADHPSHAQAQTQAAAGDDQPPVLRAGATVIRAVTRAAQALAGAVRWLVDLWRQADHKAAPTNGEAMPASPPALPLTSSSWRRP